MITVYAEKQLNGNVIIFRDAQGQTKFATYTERHAKRPDRRFKFAVLNCYKWKLEWLPDKEIE